MKNTWKWDGLEVASRLATKNIQGILCYSSYIRFEPDKVIGIRKESPLIVGLGENEFFLASDVPAILEHTNQISYLDDNEMAILNDDWGCY